MIDRMSTIKRYLLQSGEPRWRVRYLDGDQNSCSKSGFVTLAAAEEFARSMSHGAEPNQPRRRREFGRIRPSGNRYQASYLGSDGVTYRAPETFAARIDAEAWLSDRRREIDRGLWNPNVVDDKKPTFREYSTTWLDTRVHGGRPLKQRTREHYETLLKAHIVPTFGDVRIDAISAESIRRWHAKLTPNRATNRAHCYSLLKTILSSAVNAELIEANPCRIEGASTARRRSRTKPATLDQVATIVESMPERLQLMVLLATWCALRLGELTELRRGDVSAHVADPGDENDKTHGTISIQRAVVRTEGGFEVTTPKSEAGVRDVHIPPHLVPAVRDHLATHVDAGADALLFPSAADSHIQPATLYRHFYRARTAAGRPDLRFHDLRHTGAVLAAISGATLADLMQRLGHSTAGAAMKYQHAAQGRDRKIAEALSRIALE